MMDIEQLRQYALSKEESAEGFPFGETVLVFKTQGKIFMMLTLDEIPHRINLKCQPEKALELREMYPAVLPGYHMNKKHWNTVLIDGSIKDNLLLELIDVSHDLVRKKRS